MMTAEHCPCGRSLPYTKCCQPMHLGKQKPADAESLMRSRYSAFVSHKIDYLLNTLHPGKRQHDDRQILQQTCQNTQWLGLKIINADSQSISTTVEFVAFHVGEPLGQLHERSRFVWEADQWWYLDGDILPPIKLSRNAACICGSGKKFKRCHGR